jgi:hypothetical protein
MNRLAYIVFSLSIAFLSISFISNSQSDWTFYKEVDGVKIYTQEIKCELRPNIENTYLIFKYHNTGASTKTLSWRMDLHYGGICRACNMNSPNEYEINLVLNANETVKGDCASNKHHLKVFKKSDRGDLTPLDRFEFTNLNVQ